MEPQGLAMALGKQAQPMRDIDQLVQLIKRGVSPEELVQQGIPAELVQAAVEAVQKEATEIPADQAGLANSMMREQM